MCFAADKISSGIGLHAERGICALNAMSTITCTLGTGTGSQPRAWTT